jgi:hypothetical protein
MTDGKRELTCVERMVREHPQGTTPANGALDSPAKIQGYVERMKSASTDRVRQNRRARQESAARARRRRVL